MIQRIKKILRPVYVPIASWYYDTFRAPKRYRYLFETIRDIRPTSILEVGVWNGKRAMEMLTLARELSPNVSIKYYGFDLFEALADAMYRDEISKKPPTQAEVRALIETTGADAQLFAGNTLETLPKAIRELPKVDFMFIDGGHSYDTILSDWEACAELMHERTVVIFDDYWRNRDDHGAKRVVDAIDTTQYRVEVLPIIDSFTNDDFGTLDISFAKVTKRA